jgi:hypothetical protein
MNASGIVRLYEKLTPQERCQLILAAASRGDMDEFDRLGRSAPKMTLSCAHDWPLLVAFHHLSWLHLLELLDLAAQLFQRLGWAAVSGQSDTECLVGHCLLFRVQLAGWEQFCTELGIDPHLTWRELPGFVMVTLADRTARVSDRLCPEEDRVLTTSSTDGAEEPLTAETIAAKLWADWPTFAEMLGAPAGSVLRRKDALATSG